METRAVVARARTRTRTRASYITKTRAWTRASYSTKTRAWTRAWTRTKTRASTRAWTRASTRTKTRASTRAWTRTQEAVGKGVSPVAGARRGRPPAVSAHRHTHPRSVSGDVMIVVMSPPYVVNDVVVL